MIPNASACGICGFTLAALDVKLGRVHAAIDPIMDVAHCLRLADRTMLEALLDDFERRFPQVHLALFLGVLPADMSVVEAGFWILNRGVRKRRGEVCDNRFGLLVLVDPAARQVGISLGYALESLLQPKALSSLLEKHSHHLWHSDYGTALRQIIHGLDDQLRKVGSARRRATDTPAPAEPAGRLGLRKNTRPMDLPPPEREEAKR